MARQEIKTQTIRNIVVSLHAQIVEMEVEIEMLNLQLDVLKRRQEQCWYKGNRGQRLMIADKKALATTLNDEARMRQDRVLRLMSAAQDLRFAKHGLQQLAKTGVERIVFDQEPAKETA